MTHRRSVVVQLEWLGLTTLVFGLLIWPACGQPTATTPPNRVVVHAGRMLDVRAGRWITDQNIFIEGDKIARIEPGPARLVPGWTQLDLGNAAVLPGLIDCHVHLTLSPSSFGYELLGVSEARQTLTGAANARKTLLAGFTTVRNVGAWGYTDVALRDAINAGDVPGPRLLVSGAQLCNTSSSSFSKADLGMRHANLDPDIAASMRHSL